jgi:hypothetical protein
VSYRSKRLEHSIEALGVLAGLGIGFLLRRRSAGTKFGYALFAGMGSLVLEGALGTSASGFLRYFFAGVVLGVCFWVVRRIFGGLRARKNRTAAIPAAPPVPLPPDAAESAPDQSQTTPGA